MRAGAPGTRPVWSVTSRPARAKCVHTCVACSSLPPASGSSRSRNASTWMRRTPAASACSAMRSWIGRARTWGASGSNGRSGPRRLDRAVRCGSRAGATYSTPLVSAGRTNPPRSLVIPMFDERMRIGETIRTLAGSALARPGPRDRLRRRRQQRRHRRRRRVGHRRGRPRRRSGAAPGQQPGQGGGGAGRDARRRPARPGSSSTPTSASAPRTSTGASPRSRPAPISSTAPGRTPAASCTATSRSTGCSRGGRSTCCCAPSTSPRSATPSAV